MKEQFITINFPTIPPNELRLGNWFKWCSLASMGRGYAQIQHAHYIEAYAQFKEPIPLTQDILLKCGFIYDDNEECYVLELENGTAFSHIIEGITHYWSDYEAMWVDIKQEIKYLHQLQNLIYSITGQELIVKLPTIPNDPLPI